MAILWYFKVTFHSPIILSIIFIADSSIDMLSFLFGPLIDRLYIKNLLTYVTLGQTILSAITFILFLLDKKANLYLIIALVICYVISTIGSTLIYPAESKILPTIVSKTKLVKINGIFQMTYQTLDLFLDSLATLMITYLSLNFTMIASLLFFSLALTFYAKLYLPVQLDHKASEYFNDNYLKDLITGWKTLKNEGRILFLILPFALTNLFYGIASVGLPYFASSYLSKQAIGYGGIEFTSSLGAILGSVTVQHFNFGKEKLERFVTLCLLFAGISVILQPLLVKSLSWGVLILFVSSGTWISMMNITFQVLVQESFNSQVLGRIETINSSIINCMIPIGSFLGGIIVHYYGASSAIALQGITEVVTAIFYFFVFLRNK